MPHGDIWPQSSQFQENKTYFTLKIHRDFPDGAVVKNLPAHAEDTGSSPRPGRSHTLRGN